MQLLRPVQPQQIVLDSRRWALKQHAIGIAGVYCSLGKLIHLQLVLDQGSDEQIFKALLLNDPLYICCAAGLLQLASV